MWAVDVNARARSLCEANAAANGITNIRVSAPEEVPAELTFDRIWSNPPIHVGKVALHEMLLTWLGRLTPDGTATMVVHKHLGADSLQRWLTEQGFPTTRLASSSGYRILRQPKCLVSARAGSTSMRNREPFGRGVAANAVPSWSHVGARNKTTSPADDASRPVAAANSVAPAP